MNRILELQDLKKRILKAEEIKKEVDEIDLAGCPNLPTKAVPTFLNSSLCSAIVSIPSFSVESLYLITIPNLFSMIN